MACMSVMQCVGESVGTADISPPQAMPKTKYGVAMFLVKYLCG